MMALITVIVFSFVQSIFGMGLLIFGTPTLVILGYDFFGTLANLLPASITISFLQIMEDKYVDSMFSTKFLIWGMPSVVLGLSIFIQFEPKIPLEIVLGGLLLLFASVRLLPNVAARAAAAVREHTRFWMIAMGLIHGLSNLGGSVLSVVASAFFSEKKDIRKTIAYCYFCFAAIQISILAFARPGIFEWRHALTVVLAGLVYVAIGRRTFQFISQPVYEKLFICFMYFYAVILLGKGVGLICASCA